MIIGINARYLAEPSTGLGQFTLHLCRTLVRIAPQHRFLLYVQSGRPTETPGHGNYRIIPIPIENRDRFDRNFTEHEAFRAQPPDILHITHLNMPRNSSGIPVLLTIHDIIPVAFMRPGMILRGKTPLRSLTSMGIASRITDPPRIRKATLINTDSLVSARDIRRSFHYSREIPVVPLGMDADILPVPTVEQIRATEAAYGINRPYLINCSGLAFRKNIKKQIRAFARVRREHPELTFVITGEGFWHKKLADKPAPGVLFTGRLPREALGALLHGALFSSYMSLYEGYGLPVLESVSCGTPVITSRGTSMEEILPGHTLLADPYSVSSITTAMLEMVRQQEHWQSVTHDARDSLPEYTWEKTATRYLELYQQVAGS